jgi:hypothetical protein
MQLVFCFPLNRLDTLKIIDIYNQNLLVTDLCCLSTSSGDGSHQQAYSLSEGNMHIQLAFKLARIYANLDRLITIIELLGSFLGIPLFVIYTNCREILK